jgi:hypothetical protein
MDQQEHCQCLFPFPAWGSSRRPAGGLLLSRAEDGVPCAGAGIYSVQVTYLPDSQLKNSGHLSLNAILVLPLKRLVIRSKTDDPSRCDSTESRLYRPGLCRANEPMKLEQVPPIHLSVCATEGSERSPDVSCPGSIQGDTYVLKVSLNTPSWGKQTGDLTVTQEEHDTTVRVYT